MALAQFIQNFTGDGYLLVCNGHPSRATYLKNGDASKIPVNLDAEMYFGPAIYKNVEEGPASKENALGARALWVDNDDLTLPLMTLPYSAVVFSGHGYHFYWFLDAMYPPDVIEELNQLMIDDLEGSDVDTSCWNVNRVLRIPGSLNKKNANAPGGVVEVKLVDYRPEIRYTVDEIKLLTALSDKIKKKIKTGDARGYRSRSELDFAVIAHLIDKGADDTFIKRIFEYQAVGDKYRSPDTKPHYLTRTIEQARKKSATKQKNSAQAVPSILEQADGYYNTSTGARLSTFTLDPKLLLLGSDSGGEDALLCDVKTNGYTWEDISFPKSAFNSLARMDRECPLAAWQFLGKEEDVRRLLPHLYTKLEARGLPKVAATPVIGYHVVDGTPYFVGTKQVISATDSWDGFQGPIAWLPSRKEHPELDLSGLGGVEKSNEADEHVVADDAGNNGVAVISNVAVDTSAADLALLRECIPQLNLPGVIWPMIGWYAAAPLKEWLKDQGGYPSFPILNATGTFGSGKTTLIQRIFMRLFGQAEPKSYDAGTTKFVILALLGSTNAVPIAFSEFRYDSVEKFLRYILQTYDIGHDPRGKSDQTTVDYPLIAPFTIDGEDAIADPAAKERTVTISLSKYTVEEGSEARKAFARLEPALPTWFAKYYIQMCLKLIGGVEAKALLDEARADLFEAFPHKLPGRVRNNYTLVLFGIKLFCRAIGLKAPEASVLELSIRNVCDLDTGRSRPLVDDFIEALANQVGREYIHVPFRWEYEKTTNVLFFQMASAHPWWLSARKRQGRSGLERDAIRSQLREQPYYKGTQPIDGVLMHGVDLKIAHEMQLEVPAYIEFLEARMRQ